MLKAQGLEYELHGEGEPVLFIHRSHVADAFLPLTREAVLGGRYRLVRYHRRGFSGSDSHARPFSIAGQAQDVLALGGGSDWRAEVQRTVPGGPEQAETDAMTCYEVELPALEAWRLSKEQASRGLSTKRTRFQMGAVRH